MTAISVELHSITGSEAAAGWADGHTVVIDRPEGRAGGQGLGFNGAQLLALAIGGCFCNDLRYVAHERGVIIGEIFVTVTVEVEGPPLITTSAAMTVKLTTTDGSDPQALIDATKAITMVTNSVTRGFPVLITGA